jgi:hypothetical protein
MLLLVVPVLLLVKPVLQLFVSVLLLVKPVLQLVKPVYVILSKIRRITAQLITTVVHLSVFLAVKPKTALELLQKGLFLTTYAKVSISKKKRLMGKFVTQTFLFVRHRRVVYSNGA